MLALEEGRVIVVFGIGAHDSVLSGRRHQGRTVQRAEEQLAARLLVGDAVSIVVLSGALRRFIFTLGGVS